jgi:glycosyltransferase involved in cell wall biosynthesis
MVEQFDALKDMGEDLQLVLVGSDFRNLDSIKDFRIKEAIMNSSYKEDIILPGYVSDEFKQLLYQNALCFVFPSLYEGFGLPILEAMLFDCPVITYRNSSLEEIGEGYVFFATDAFDIVNQVIRIRAQSVRENENLLQIANAHVQSFSWSKSVDKYYTLIKRSLK